MGRSGALVSRDVARSREPAAESNKLGPARGPRELGLGCLLDGEARNAQPGIPKSGSGHALHKNASTVAA